MTYRIEYRLNKHGNGRKAWHCYDVRDETGRCVRVFRCTNRDAVKAEAEAWLHERNPTAAPPDQLAEAERSQALADLRKAGAS